MNKTYYAVIPASIRYDKNLSSSAKLLYGEITALTNEKGYCYASNQYFASLYKVSKTTISRWITLLTKNDHLTILIMYHENTKEVKERRLYIKEGIVLDEYTPHNNNVSPPIRKKRKVNTTLSNTTVNNKCINQLAVDWDGLLENFKRITGKQKTHIVNEKVKKKYVALLKEGYQKKDILVAMKNAVKDEYHIETNFKHLTLEYFSRPATIDRFIEVLKEVGKSETMTIKSEEYDR